MQPEKIESKPKRYITVFWMNNPANQISTEFKLTSRGYTINSSTKCLEFIEAVQPFDPDQSYQIYRMIPLTAIMQIVEVMK